METAQEEAVEVVMKTKFYTDAFLGHSLTDVSVYWLGHRTDDRIRIR